MKLFADFRQIHVCNPDYTGDLADAWTAKATDDRIAAAGDIIGIGTEQATDVDVTVAVLATEPARRAAEHATEASITLGAKVAVLGCTDEVRKAKTFKTTPGIYRVRATHTNLAKRERIHLELWPAKRAKAPAVLVRYKPPKPTVKAPDAKRPKTRKQAVEAALAGKTDIALEVLLELHTKGDAAASASAAEILAFMGRWDEATSCAKALLAKPDAVYAGNVSDDMKGIVKRAKGQYTPPREEGPRLAHYQSAVAKAEADPKRWKGKPAELARHLFALAWVFEIDDEIIRRWDPKASNMHFNEAVHVARALVRKKDAKRAWQVLEGKLASWGPVDAAQVLPVVLVTDSYLGPLLTPERAEVVMRTPRARW